MSSGCFCLSIWWSGEWLVCGESSRRRWVESLVTASFPAGVRTDLKCFRNKTKAQNQTGGWRLEGTCGALLVQHLLKQVSLEQVSQDHVLLSLVDLLEAVPGGQSRDKTQAAHSGQEGLKVHMQPPSPAACCPLQTSSLHADCRAVSSDPANPWQW